MPHSAIALSRDDSGWTGRDIDLTDVEDLDTLGDELRELSDGTLTLLFLEEDDEYVAVVRVEGDDDPRVFLSDRRVLDTSELASRLFEDALPVEPPVDDDEESARPAAEPAGDLDLLADVGTPGDALVELCAEEGMLPSDVIAAVAERAGAAEVLDEVRGTA